MSASSRTVEHVGEWLVQVEADSPMEIFAEVARVIAEAAGETGPELSAWRDVTVDGRDPASLLVAYANELISLCEIDQCAYSELREGVVSFDTRCRFSGQIRGRRVEAWHSPLKAATYHGAVLEPGEGGWRAEVLFDV